jgi:transcriptional regulator with XRE-family HTH domain
MKQFFKRGARETMSEDALVQEIDERHFISEQVFFRREERGWSQDQLATEAGMTQAQVALIEAGQANPTLRSLVKLAHAFGCSVSDLAAPREEDSAGETSAHVAAEPLSV